MRRLDLYLQFDRPLTPAELDVFKQRLRRRVRGEPLQYISATAAFRDLTLAVDGRVLIPRPETEVLVQAVLDWAGERQGLDVVDVGTGSGAIALSLRHEGDFGRIVATDVSADALDLARANRERTLPDAEIEFRLGAAYAPIAGERYDIIVSNPPYAADDDRASLPKEVADWEPAEALFGGRDGLDVVRRLIQGGPDHLRPGGLLALEIGAGQAATVAELVRSTPSYSDPDVRLDLAGRERIVLARIE